MSKQTPAQRELAQAFLDLDPGIAAYHTEQRDRQWVGANINTTGLKHPRAAEWSSQIDAATLFTRRQVTVLLERTVNARDHIWRIWLTDPIAMAQLPHGPGNHNFNPDKE